ncbi:MAG TPA: hypothetical protein VHP30_15680 [Ignavibacteriales bacterium]|nr:hypothetical protein [Ignavibacteriales bacterium]
MRFIKKALLAAVIPLLFISCNDEVVNNYYKGAEGTLDVAVKDCEYEIIAAHKSYFDPNYGTVGYDGDFSYGMKLTVKLADPSKRAGVNRLLIASNSYGYDFNKKELEEAYVDSVGGYVFDFITLDMIGSYSSLNFDVKLYDALNNSSNAYPFIARFNLLTRLGSDNAWSGKNELEIRITTYNTQPAARAKVETHYLDADFKEVGVYRSDIVGNKWTTADVPAEALYYYFIIADKYSDINRKYISARYAIKDRLPDNVEFINGAAYPSKIEYLKNLDKVLILSTGAKELTLLNYEDNSIVWKKELSAAPATFAYSAGRNAIYLAYTNGVVDSVNPADGGSKQLFTCSRSIMRLLPADNFLIVFTQNSYDYYRYDFRDKSLTSLYNSGLYNIYAALYVPKTRMIYVRDNNDVDAYTLGFDGDISLFAHLYLDANIYGESVWTMNLNADSTKLYLGEGYAFKVPNGQNNPAGSAINYFVNSIFLSY